MSWGCSVSRHALRLDIHSSTSNTDSGYSNQLLVEKFMNGDDLFTGNGEDAVDQWTLDQTSGAAAALQKHWVCTPFVADPS